MPCLAFSWSGSLGVWLGLAGTLWFLSSRQVELVPRQHEFLSGMATALPALAIGSVLKRVVRRPRPYVADARILRGIWAPGPYASFPSTHAATSVALASALLKSGHPLALPVALWALGVSFSRVYLSVHHTSDVLAGALLGVAAGTLAPYFGLPTTGADFLRDF